LYVDRMLSRSFMTDVNYRKSWQDKSIAEICAELGLPRPAAGRPTHGRPHDRSRHAIDGESRSDV
jgi:hypothetical protein